MLAVGIMAICSVSVAPIEFSTDNTEKMVRFSV